MFKSNTSKLAIKKAIILAAGMGKRLGEITAGKPKALVEVNGKPMLQILIEKLKKEGISDFLINIHHYGEQLLDFLKTKDNFNVNISISDERNKLLDTGGAILKARNFIQGKDTVLVHNVDVLSDVDLEALYFEHKRFEATATLCVRKRESSRALLFDDKMSLVGWTNKLSKEFKWVNHAIEHYSEFAFSGIYMIAPEFVQKIEGPNKFSIIDAWLKMASESKIIGYEDNSETWFDLGTKDKIEKAEKYIKKTDID